MFGLLPNPWVIIGVAMAVMSAFGGGYWKGHHDEYVSQQVEIGKLNAKARSLENELAEQATNQSIELKKAQDDANNEISRLKSDVALGAVRLSIATRSVPVPGSSTTTCGNGAAARAELDPEAAQSLIAIAAEGDAAIRQLNALIDFYNNTRGKLNER